MSKTIARWLRNQFKTVPDVRSARSDPDPSVVFQRHTADVVVATWMGARLYVYLLKHDPSARDIKNTLKDNTRNGIGSLFIVRDALLPAHDDTVHASDWQATLFALQDDFIYSYVMDADAGKLSLSQVHFTPVGSSGEFRVWHITDFDIQSVNVRKQSVSAGSAKGEWRMGDIASPDYKRRVNHERASQRFHYRTKYTREIPRNGNGSANGNGLHPDQPQVKQAMSILGVDADASQGDVKRAYRKRALQVHPDVSALPRQEADRRFKELNRAYETIKQANGWR